MRLVFPEVRLTSVRIVWQPPEEPNGIILGKAQAGAGGGAGSGRGRHGSEKQQVGAVI